MNYKMFGKSGLNISVLGFGAGHIGGSELTDKEAEQLLFAALDSGINFFDTARAYGSSEERIGKFLSGRKEAIISTKIGYGLPGIPDWTYDCIIAGVDAALKLLKRDRLDIVHFHSCPLHLLKRGEITEALLRTKAEGKILCAAYSGENEEVEFAVNSGQFDSVQCSINIADQRNIKRVLPAAKEKGIGVIAKRPLANAPWRFSTQPYGNYAEDYWLRLQKMNPGIANIEEAALRFAVYSEGVSTAIAGTSKIENLKRNVAIAEKGPLPDDVYAAIREAFDRNDDNWRSLI